MPLPKFSRDPLLAAAQVLLGLFMGAIILALVLITLGAAAVVTVQRADITAKIADAGLSGTVGVWSIFGGLAALGVLLALAFRFTMELDRIIKSVDRGDPFMPENAGRLARMGWLALVIHGIGLALAFGHARVERLAGHAHSPTNMTGTLLGGLALVITLFILARVFQHGAAMRDDLEGMV